jgi:hypothetical protein
MRNHQIQNDLITLLVASWSIPRIIGMVFPGNMDRLAFPSFSLSISPLCTELHAAQGKIRCLTKVVRQGDVHGKVESIDERPDAQILIMEQRWGGL